MNQPVLAARIAKEGALRPAMLWHRFSFLLPPHRLSLQTMIQKLLPLIRLLEADRTTVTAKG
jgi:hypothetical protein